MGEVVKQGTSGQNVEQLGGMSFNEGLGLPTGSGNTAPIHEGFGGQIRQNSLTSVIETWDGSQWVGISSSSGASGAGPGRMLVDAKMNNYFGSERVAATGGVYDTVRTRHQNLTGKTLKSIVLVYGNWAPLAGIEINGTNPIIIQASLEMLSPSGVNTQDQNREQAVFNGLFVATIPGGVVVESDPIPCYIQPGEYFYVRTASTVANNGEKIFRGLSCLGGTSGFGQNTGEGGSAGALSVNNAASAINVNVQTAVYSPCAILGETICGTTGPTVGKAGDSIANGVDDAGFAYGYGGYVYRLFQGYPGVNVPLSGEKLADVISLKNYTSRLRVMRYASTIFCEYLRNDIEQGRTVDQCKADILTFAKIWMLMGKRFVQATCLPAPTSSNGFFDVAGQTKQTAAKEDVRTGVNSWIRDTSNSGFVAQALAQVATVPNAGDAAFYDPCIYVECNSSGIAALNGGFIFGSQSAVKTSGTATSGTVTALNDIAQTWTINAFKGSTIYIESGTGAGQVRSIGFNTATQIGVSNSFSPAPDSSSVYKVYDALGMNGVHPCSVGHALAASGNPALLVK